MNEQVLTKLAEQGVLGLLLVLAILAIIFLFKELRKERDARLQDLRDIFKSNLEWRSELKALLDNIFDILRAKK